MGGIAVEGNCQTQAAQSLNYDAEYDKILKLRDEIVAGTHPRLKPSKQIRSIAPLPSIPAAPKTNGVSKPPAVAPGPVADELATTTPSQAAPVLNSAIPTTSTSLPVLSDFDPILLTKGPALVREERLRKRRAIEQRIRDQYAKQQRLSRRKLLEGEPLPDFNVTQVLERAQGIVKPVRFAEGKSADRAASSSSFDENDYYSSQVNSRTTDASPKRQLSSRGDEAGGVQAMDIDADEQASSRVQPRADPSPKKNDEVAAAQAAEIAQLKEQLRIAEEKNAAMHRVETPPRQQGMIEEPDYSPPDAPIVNQAQRQMRTLSIEQDQAREPAPRRSSRPLPPQSREYAAARNESAPSPVQNDMRIVRNHITSPLAPQPARVSPLAVAKAPPASQIKETQRNERRAPRAAGSENFRNGRNSPEQPVQPLTSRKRRRNRGSGETGRNVVPRRENNSPEVRIKEEPVSPQLRPTAMEAWRPPRTEEVIRPVYVNTNSPQRRLSGYGAISARNERLSQQSHAGGTVRPLTPGQVIEINDEPDLRRVVTTRQVSPLSRQESRRMYLMHSITDAYAASWSRTSETIPSTGSTTFNNTLLS